MRWPRSFPDKVYISCYEDVNPEVDAEQILEEVAHNNADVVFATSVRMYNACLKVAAQHPKTRILNCSLNAPHPLVRTYYPRTYEVTYLLGMLAGIMTKTGHIGYVAANPVYGVPAAINAFAQGLRACARQAVSGCAGPASPMPPIRWILLTARRSTWSTPGTVGSLPTPTGTTACAANCRTAAYSRWVCQSGGGIPFYVQIVRSTF